MEDVLERRKSELIQAKGKLKCDRFRAIIVPAKMTSFSSFYLHRSWTVGSNLVVPMGVGNNFASWFYFLRNRAFKRVRYHICNKQSVDNKRESFKRQVSIIYTNLNEPVQKELKCKNRVKVINR